MAPPTWQLVLTTEEGSQFSSLQFKSNLCPCQCCWCEKCDFKRLPDGALVSMLPRLFPSDDTKQPFWSLVLIFTDGSEFPSRPLKPVVGLCRYCWCQQRGSEQIQESDLADIQSFFSDDAAASLQELLGGCNSAVTSSLPISSGTNQQNSDIFVNNFPEASSYEPVSLKELLQQKSGKNPHRTVCSDDDLFQSASDEDQMSSNAEDEDPTWIESGDLDVQSQQASTKRQSSRRPKPIRAKEPYHCDECSSAFTRSNLLQNHKRIHLKEKSIHSRDRRYKCTECPSTFINSTSFENHKRRVHPRNNSQKIDKQQRRNRKNEVTKSIKKERTCLKCNRLFEDKQALHWHMKKEHNPSRPFKCGLCPSRFKAEDQQIIHQRTHKDKQGKYSCSQCKYSSVYAKNLVKHILSHSRKKLSPNNDNVNKTEEMVSGNTVGLTLESNSKMARNLQSGSSIKPARTSTATRTNNNCVPTSSTSIQNNNQQVVVAMGSIALYESDCSRQFLNEFAGDSTWTGTENSEEGPMYEANDGNEDESKYQLAEGRPADEIMCSESTSKLPQRQPRQQRATKKQFRFRHRQKSCPECTLSFDSIDSLDQHLREHNPTHPFKCYVCSVRFETREKKNVHQISHKDETGRYKCNLCQYSSLQPSSFTKHMRFHNGERPHKCDECQKAFPLPHHLKEHKRIHTGETPFKCNFCPRAFTQSSTLKHHMEIHSGKSPYTCDQCSKLFVHLRGLRDHKRAHSDCGTSHK